VAEDNSKRSEQRGAFGFLNPADLDYGEWSKASAAAKGIGVPYEVWNAWCSRDAERYDAEDNRCKWETMEPCDGNVLIELACTHGWKDPDSSEPGSVMAADSPQPTEDGDGAAGMELLRMEEITGENTLPMPPDVVDGIIAERELTTLVGPSGSGKSWLAMDLGVSVASGTPWLGIDTSRQPVIYVNLEITDNSFSNRLDALRRSKGVGPSTDFSVTSLGSVEGQNAEGIVRGLKSLKVHGTFVIIDCLYMLEEDDENDNAYMKSLMAELKKLCTDCGDTVFVVHHTKKGGANSSAVVDRGAGAGTIGRFANNRIALGELEMPEGSEMESELSANGCRAMRLEMVTRDHPFHKPIDLIYSGIRFIPDVSGKLAQCELKSSYTGTRSHAVNTKRAQAMNETRNAFMKEILNGIEERGSVPNVETVLHDYNAAAGAHGLRSISEQTLRNNLKPSYAQFSYRLEDGKIVAA
jgi:hypothetical protein